MSCWEDQKWSYWRFFGWVKTYYFSIFWGIYIHWTATLEYHPGTRVLAHNHLVTCCYPGNWGEYRRILDPLHTILQWKGSWRSPELLFECFRFICVHLHLNRVFMDFPILPCCRPLHTVMASGRNGTFKFADLQGRALAKPEFGWENERRQERELKMLHETFRNCTVTLKSHPLIKHSQEAIV